MTKQPAEIEHLHARMIVFVGCTIAVTFALTVIGFVYGLLFVTQPQQMAELDAAQINILSSMLLTLSGGLIGLLAGNGLKDKPKDKDDNSQSNSEK